MRVSLKKPNEIKKKGRKVASRSRNIKKEHSKACAKPKFFNKSSILSSTKSYESTDESDGEIETIPYVNYKNIHYFSKFIFLRLL